MKRFSLCVALLASAGALPAQTVSGTVTIVRRMTHRSVTATIPVYSRGLTPTVGVDAPVDDLVAERGRVVLYLEGSGLPASPSSAAATMQQVNRKFLPEMLIVPAGGTVNFPNGDPIFHNIFSLSQAKSFDLGTYDKGQTRSVTFPKAGVVFVYCHLHPNMAASIVVTPNRWYAQPTGDGQYRIADVPPGRYTLVAWHKAAGFHRRQITVSAAGAAHEDFFLPVGDNGAVTPGAVK